MKKYRARKGETLGSIARTYALPSWKYLYELNKDSIGDNPDLLNPGTELKIPLWDSTSGDEKIKAKGVPLFPYVGGASYAYPWVPLSVTLVNRRGEVLREKNASGDMSEEFEKEKEYVITDGASGKELARGTLKRADELEVLVPDAEWKVITVDGVTYELEAGRR